MKRSSWIFALLIIVAFTVVRLHSTPSVPYPGNAVAVQQGIQVPVKMSTPSNGSEFWSLMRKANHQYVVRVFNHQRIVQQFIAQKSANQTSSGTLYTTSGQITLGGNSYQATRIYIAASGKSGYIQLSKVDQAAKH